MNAALRVIVGLTVLFFGRPLYWAFIALTGILIGVDLGQELLIDYAPWVQWLAAAGAGVLGAVLSIVAQRVGFAVGGFYAGSYLGFMAEQYLFPDQRQTAWLLAAGLVGAILAALLMDWAIIVISSLLGAGWVISVIHGEDPLAATIYILLAACGVEYQSYWMSRGRVSPGTSSAVH